MNRWQREQDGKTGETYVTGAFEQLKWGPTRNQHDRGSDLFALVRDERGAELGLMVGLQVKSGYAAESTTYFKQAERDSDGDVSGWWYYEAKRSRLEALASHAVPHLLVLHDLGNQISYWAHITPEAIVPVRRGGKLGKGARVFVPAANTVDEGHREALLAVAATMRSRVSWEGSRWAGSDGLVPADLLRYALIVPRLIAPHPNAGLTSPLTPEKAIALLLNGEPDHLARLVDAFPDTPSLAQAAESPYWRWRFVGAVSQHISSGDIEMLQALVADAPDPPARAASTVAAATALIENGRSEDAIELLEEALDCGEVAPVDHAWLTAQRARACTEVGRIRRARADAIDVQNVRLKAPEDATANAIAGAAIALLFNTSWLQSEIVEEAVDAQDSQDRPAEDADMGLIPPVGIDAPDTRNIPIGAAVEAADTAATWWRTQTMSSGLNALAGRTFNAWAEGLSVTIGAPDTVHDKLVAASLSASYLGDHGALCGQAGLLGRAMLQQSDRYADPPTVCDALDALRRAGDESALKNAVQHIAADGPVEAITLAAAKVNLENSTRTTGPCNLTLLQYGGDLLDDETAIRSVDWLLATIADPKKFVDRTSALYTVQFRLIETLIGLAANPNVYRVIAEYLLALSPQEDQLIATAWARVVRVLPDQAWDDAMFRRAAGRLEAHQAELGTALIGVAARFDEHARAVLDSEIKDGSLNALSALGDVRKLPTQDVKSQIERLADQGERQIQDAEAGSFGFGGHDIGSALAVLNAWHPEVAKWPPLLDLLANDAVAKEHKVRTLESLAALSEQIPEDVRKRLRPIAIAIAEGTTSEVTSLFDDGRDLAGQGTNVALANGADPAWASQMLLRLLSGPPYHRYWATQVAARLKRPQDTGILISLAQDPISDVRAGAAAGLASLVADNEKTSFAAQALERCLDDPGRKVPATIAVVLTAASKRGRFARSALDRLQTHRSAYIRNVVTRRRA